MIFFTIIVIPALVFGVLLSMIGISVIEKPMMFFILSFVNAVILSIIYNGVK